ncbi:MAG: aminotransferase class I/II-fold pyridoxal phosphate-dependent enzyme [Nannocystaceae bacterium]
MSYPHDHTTALLSPTVRGLEPSPTVATNERCEQLRAEGREIFKLGLGQSPFPVPPSVVEALRAHAHRREYMAVKGLWALREEVSAHHRRRLGISVHPDHVLIGPGSKELMFLLQVVFAGELLLPTPAWVSYEPQARIVGRGVRLLQTRIEDEYRLLPEDFERALARDPQRPRVLILNDPSNPTGVSYDDDHLARLAEIAGRHGVILLADEIYSDLRFTGEHRSIARHLPQGTIVSGGLSKWCGAGGWRLGTFAAPPSLGWLIEAMAAVASETFTSTSAPIQMAAIRAFQGGTDLELYLRDARRILAALGGWITARLRRADLRVCEAAGGFYLFPDFSAHAAALAARGIHSSDALCRQLLEDTGVATLPGSVFGRPPEELTLRLAFVDFDGARALTAVEHRPQAEPLDDAWLTEHCGAVVAAIERLTRWLAAG